jgi:transposase
LSLDLPAECGFYEDIKMEWAEHGNKIEEFEIKGPKIVIILDNASIHKKKEFLEK